MSAAGDVINNSQIQELIITDKKKSRRRRPCLRQAQAAASTIDYHLPITN
jgi:hypothetical protein